MYCLLVIRQIILTYTYGGINRTFSGRLRLSVIFDYRANGNRSLARIIEVLLYFPNGFVVALHIPSTTTFIHLRQKRPGAKMAIPLHTTAQTEKVFFLTFPYTFSI